MSVFMSCVITIVNTGLQGDFLHCWGMAWMFAFPLAFLVGNFFSPLAKKLAAKLTKTYFFVNITQLSLSLKAILFLYFISISFTPFEI